MILNLRGTSGSGKSTVAFDLIQGAAEISLAPYKTKRGADRWVTGYRVGDLIVVGAYRTACGGCDSIHTQDLICESVRMATAQARHVFFEGLLISGLFSRYLILSRDLGGMTWAYLDTPLQKCLDRIYVRNGGKPIKEENTRGKYKATIATREKAQAAGEHTVIVDHMRAVEQVRELLSCT